MIRPNIKVMRRDRSNQIVVSCISKYNDKTYIKVMRRDRSNQIVVSCISKYNDKTYIKV